MNVIAEYSVLNRTAYSGAPISARYTFVSPKVLGGAIVAASVDTWPMNGPPEDRRLSKRVKQTQTIRIRPADPKFAEEVRLTLNVSWDGLYFATSKHHYCVGLEVFVTRNYRPQDTDTLEEKGSVVRVDELRAGRWGVAVKFAAEE
jgi:hypothetical protein